ncbi:MAG: hypothetical protein USCGTAYLOR_01853 [Chromatiales bacterium USCg_Taylor]|nr:MAG: hypothetical protein USCGTAYLOR_01853 [Chromatiales bacterium USCg_Taylor]
MGQYYRNLCQLLALVLVSSISLDASAGIKCWTNKEGVRECGNAVPAEYAQQGHTKFNAQGVAVGHRKRAKSQAEFAEEERIKKQKAEEDRKRQEAEKADRVLLDTFSSEDDLVFAREGMVSAIEAQIQLTESHIQKIQANLDRMIVIAADLERSGQKPTEQAMADIEKVRAQIADNRSFIETKRKEQESVRQQYVADIERFRKLTGKE